MSFYGQMIQQIKGAIDKITIAKQNDSSVDMGGAVILKESDFIKLQTTNGSDTVTIEHVAQDYGSNEYQVLVRGSEEGAWSIADLDDAGHITKPSAGSNLKLGCSYTDTNNDGNITIS